MRGTTATWLALAMVAMLAAPALAQTPAPTPAPPAAPPSAAGAAAGALPSCATPPPGSAPEAGPSVILTILRCWRELGLTEAQLARLQEIATGFLRDAIRRQADMDVAELDLGVLLGVDPADPASAKDLVAVEAKLRRLAQMWADLEMAALRAVEAGKAVLTPAQRAALAALFAAETPPVAVSPPAYVPPPTYRYYCPSAGGYWPNVPSCPEPWVPVLAGRPRAGVSRGTGEGRGTTPSAGPGVRGRTGPRRLRPVSRRARGPGARRACRRG